MLRYVVLLLLLLIRALPVLAHAAPVNSEPRGGATLAVAPDAVRLEFSQPVELKFSRVEVRAGRSLVSDRADLRLESGRMLVQPLPPLAAGRYDVKWRVLSTDGHVTEGSFWFVVAADGAGPAAGAGLAAAPPVEQAVNWGLYALVLLVASPLAFILLTTRGAVRW